jgi:hypothetical protein
MLDTLFPKRNFGPRHARFLPSRRKLGPRAQGQASNDAAVSIVGKYGLKETYVLDLREHDKEQRRGGRLMPMQRHTVMPRRLTSKTITSGSFSYGKDGAPPSSTSVSTTAV